MLSRYSASQRLIEVVTSHFITSGSLPTSDCTHKIHVLRRVKERVAFNSDDPDNDAALTQPLLALARVAKELDNQDVQALADSILKEYSA